jgi:hypothetical protein
VLRGVLTGNEPQLDSTLTFHVGPALILIWGAGGSLDAFLHVGQKMSLSLLLTSIIDLSSVIMLHAV